MAIYGKSVRHAGILFCAIAVLVIGFMAIVVGARSYILEEAPQAEITVPFSIEGTSLIAEKIVSYDGPFLEDGSGDEVFGVSTLVVKNTGTTGVEHARITLVVDDGFLEFDINKLPAGATVAVLEKNRAKYRSYSLYRGYGEQSLLNEGWGDWPVLIEPYDLGSFLITNNTENTLRNININYKNYLPGIYVGGIAYHISYPFLQPGQSVVLYPEHYVSGYSTIVYISTQ